MAIKKIGFEFDPFEMVGREPPKSKAKRDEVAQDIADAVLDYILEQVDKGESPVKGGAWKKTLSKEYKAKKTAEGGKPYSDMLLEGDMLSALRAETRRGGKIWVGIDDPTEAAKADGHNNHSGDSQLPPREFIPKKDQVWKKPLLDDIKFLIDEASESEDG